MVHCFSNRSDCPLVHGVALRLRRRSPAGRVRKRRHQSQFRPTNLEVSFSLYSSLIRPLRVSFSSSSVSSIDQAMAARSFILIHARWRQCAQVRPPGPGMRPRQCSLPPFSGISYSPLQVPAPHFLPLFRHRFQGPPHYQAPHHPPGFIHLFFLPCA